MGDKDLPLGSFLQKLNFKLGREALSKNFNKAAKSPSFSPLHEADDATTPSLPKLSHTSISHSLTYDNPRAPLSSPSPQETRAAFKTKVAAAKAEAAAPVWANPKAKPFVPDCTGPDSSIPIHGAPEPLMSQSADSIPSAKPRQEAPHKFNLPVENLAQTLRSSSLNALNPTMAPLDGSRSYNERKNLAKEVNQKTAAMLAKHQAVADRIKELRRLKKLQQQQGAVSRYAEPMEARAVQIARRIVKSGKYADSIPSQALPDIADQSSRPFSAASSHGPVDESKDIPSGLENKRPLPSVADEHARLETMRSAAEEEEKARVHDELAKAHEEAATRKLEEERTREKQREEAQRRALELEQIRFEAEKKREKERPELEAQRVEAERLEAELRQAEMEKREQELKEAERREAQRLLEAQQAHLEAQRVKAEQEAARKEAARQEAARQEAARQEAARQEAARQVAARQEAARQEAARQEAARQEAARQEAARQEAARQEAARQEAARQEAARQEAVREEIARQEAAREDIAHRQEQAKAARQVLERKEENDLLAIEAQQTEAKAKLSDLSQRLTESVEKIAIYETEIEATIEKLDSLRDAKAEAESLQTNVNSEIEQLTDKLNELSAEGEEITSRFADAYAKIEESLQQAIYHDTTVGAASLIGQRMPSPEPLQQSAGIKQPAGTIASSLNTTAATVKGSLGTDAERENVEIGEEKSHFTGWPAVPSRKQHGDPKRQVKLTNLPINSTYTKIFSIVWGGRIDSIEYTQGNNFAWVTFMRGEDCGKYYLDTSNGIEYPGQPDRTIWVEMGDPLPVSEAMRGYFDSNMTRCVRAVGVDEDWKESSLRYLAVGKDRKLENLIVGANPNGLRIVEFRFTNFQDAMRFKMELDNDIDWEHCTVYHTKDTCELNSAVHTGVD